MPKGLLLRRRSGISGCDLIGACANQAPSLGCPLLICVDAIPIVYRKRDSNAHNDTNSWWCRHAHRHSCRSRGHHWRSRFGCGVIPDHPVWACGHVWVVWLVRHLSVVGVEGTGAYGKGLTGFLTDHDVAVVEVCRVNRQSRRRHGKTDAKDAVAAARAVLSGEASAVPRDTDGPVESLRVLRIARSSAVKSRAAVLTGSSQ